MYNHGKGSREFDYLASGEVVEEIVVNETNYESHRFLNLLHTLAWSLIVFLVISPSQAASIAAMSVTKHCFGQWYCLEKVWHLGGYK